MADENAITDNYAPNWLPYFTVDGDVFPGVPFNVECGICSSRLAVNEPPDGDAVEEFTILPCGHAFGYSCAFEWIQHGNSGNPTCPSCRRSLVHSRCGHKFTPRELQLDDGGNMHKAVSDCVVEMPSKCGACIVGDGRNYCSHHLAERLENMNLRSSRLTHTRHNRDSEHGADADDRRRSQRHERSHHHNRHSQYEAPRSPRVQPRFREVDYEASSRSHRHSRHSVHQSPRSQHDEVDRSHRHSSTRHSSSRHHGHEHRHHHEASHSSHRDVARMADRFLTREERAAIAEEYGSPRRSYYGR